MTSETGSTPSAVIQTCAGRVRGFVLDGVARYRAIPYAQPPVGPLAFAEPIAALPWDGIRECVEPGSTAPQHTPSFAAIDLPPIIGEGWVRGDDYLTLDVWAPAGGGDRRPVMVWIHGGAWTLGSKDAASYDGRTFARDGAVIVAMNYRLGVEGFLPVGGGPTNLGLRDILLALHWVKDNVEAFGGDPENITVFGESAGGFNVAALVASPLAQGLFQRAIVQSGHGGFPDLQAGRRLAAKVAKRLRIPNEVGSFRATDPERFLKVLDRMAVTGSDLRGADGINPTYGLAVVTPFVGDDVIPVTPLEALRGGAGADIDLLVMTTAEEANFWFAPTPLRLLPTPLARWWLSRSDPRARRIIRAYRRVRPGARGGMVLAAATSDLAFRWPAREFAAAHRGTTWMADFDWRSPAVDGRLGAAHGLDIAFVFDTLPTVTGPKGFGGPRPPREIASRLHRIWVDFARDGSIPWGPFDTQERQVYRVAEDRSGHEAPLPAVSI